MTESFAPGVLESYGLEGKSLAISAAGAALHYLEDTQKGELSHISGIRYLEEADYLVLDPVTQRNLELTRSLTEEGRKGTLLHGRPNSQGLAPAATRRPR